MSKYIATLEVYTKPKKRCFRYESSKKNIHSAVDDVLEVFGQNDLTSEYISSSNNMHQNITGECAYIAFDNCRISIIHSLSFSANGELREIKPRFRITDFSNDLNNKRIVLEIGHLNNYERLELLEKLDNDNVNHLEELDNANYITIENYDLQGFKFFKTIGLGNNIEDIFLCPLFHDQEGYYIEDGIVLNISRDAKIDEDGLISPR